jgi:hypothetical protein
LPPQFAYLALGAESDFTGAAFSLNVFGLPGIDLDGDGLVANLFHFVDLVSLVYGSTHGVISDEFRHAASSISLMNEPGP